MRNHGMDTGSPQVLDSGTTKFLALTICRVGRRHAVDYAASGRRVRFLIRGNGFSQFRGETRFPPLGHLNRKSTRHDHQPT